MQRNENEPRKRSTLRTANGAPDSSDDAAQRASGRRRSGAKSGRKPRQSEFEFRSWGGSRRGAGRKPAGERAGMPHAERAEHKTRFPVLVTTRLCPGLPSLRHPAEAALIRTVLASVNQAEVPARLAKEEASRTAARAGAARHEGAS